MKRWMSLFMAICMVLSMIPVMVFAEEGSVVVYEGKCGPFTSWTLDDQLNLSISGFGDIAQYDDPTEVPWYKASKAIKSVTIANNVTGIGDCAFYGCTALESVSIGSGVRSIGWMAFYGCLALKSIQIPSNVTTIDDSAFEVSGLQSISVPSSVKSIGYAAFRYCGSLTSVKVAGASTTISGCAFDYTPWLKAQGDYAKINSTLLTYQGTEVNITIPDGITAIADDAFSKNGLKSVVIGDGVKSIGHRAFEGCSKLESVTIGTNVTSIGDEAFAGCTAMSTLRYNAKSVSDFSIDLQGEPKPFAQVGQAGVGVAVTFGKSVSKIPAYFFYTANTADAPNVESMTFTGNAPSIGRYAFYKITAVATYPSGDSSWTSKVMTNYGGTITWTEAPAAPVAKIAVNSTKHKTLYLVNETLDISNLTIQATLTDGSVRQIPVTAAMISGFDTSSVADSRKVTITYGGKTTTYNIRVTNGVKSIAIKTPAEKLNYVTGEELDVTGLTIEVTMVDGSKAVVPVTVGMVGGFNSRRAVDKQELSITYGGKVTSYTIRIDSSNKGDFNNDGNTTDADAIYLLNHTEDPEKYALNQEADYDGDGEVTRVDAIYLLNHTLNPERYGLQ